MFHAKERWNRKLLRRSRGASTWVKWNWRQVPFITVISLAQRKANNVSTNLRVQFCYNGPTSNNLQRDCNMLEKFHYFLLHLDGNEYIILSWKSISILQFKWLSSCVWNSQSVYVIAKLFKATFLVVSSPSPRHDKSLALVFDLVPFSKNTTAQCCRLLETGGLLRQLCEGETTS